MKYFVHHESACKWEALEWDPQWTDDGNVLEVDKELYDQLDYTTHFLHSQRIDKK